MPRRSFFHARPTTTAASLGALLVVLMISGCAASASTDVAVGAQVEVTPCAFSFDCNSSEVCGDQGVCTPAPSLEDAYLFEPNPGSSYREGELPAPLSGLGTGSPQIADSAAARGQLVAELHAGMASISLGASSSPSITEVDQEYRELEFAPTALAGPLREELEDAWQDHLALRNTLADRAAVQDLIGTMADVHAQKERVRAQMAALERNLRRLEEPVDPSGRGCDLSSDLGLRHDYYELTERTDTLIETQAALQLPQCSVMAASILDALDALALQDTDGAPLYPLDDARATLGLLRQYVEHGIDRDTHAATFTTGAALIRARELMYAISLYGHHALHTARIFSNLFPFTDMVIPRALAFDRPLGELAQDARYDADDARDLLSRALAKQNEYLRELVLNPPQSVQELSHIALLSDGFLATHPQYETIIENVLAEQRAADQARLWTGVAAGLGCAGGTIAVAWVSGPWSLAAAGTTGLVCGIDFYLQWRYLQETKALLSQAMTMRYFGVATSLESYDRIAELRQQVGRERLLTAVALIGTIASGAKLAPVLLDALRTTKIVRGIRGYVALGDLDSAMPTLLSGRFSTRLPVVFDEVAFRAAIADGRYFAFHDVAHTERVVADAERFLVALQDAGFIPHHDVELGRIAAWFHDYEQVIGGVSTDWTMRVTRVFGESEQRSADAATLWMRARGYGEVDIARVQRAIVDGTAVGYHQEYALIPEAFIDDADGFFRAVPGEARPDYLPFALSMADLGSQGGTDAGRVLAETGQLLLEENPGFARALADGTIGANDGSARLIVRSYVDFQPTLAAGRRGFALNAWADRVPHDLSGVVLQVFPGFADDALLATLQTTANGTSTMTLSEMLALLGVP